MSTSLIYHGFGAKSYNYLKTEFRCGKIYFYIEKKPEYEYCVDCKSRDVIKKGFVKREIKTVPIGGKAVIFVLKRLKAQIKAIAMDMWPAYISATMKYYPFDVIVFDKFHIVSECNKMIDKLRRKEAHTAELAEKNVFKGVRYLLLKGQESIENDYKAQYRLHRLLEVNKALNTAYILKEELRELWSCTSLDEAENYLENCLKKAWVSGIGPVIKFAKRIASHRSGILNYFKYPITTAKVEGINNKKRL